MDSLAAVSEHALTCKDDTFHCSVCLARCSRVATGIRTFLSTKCTPAVKLQNSVAIGMPIRIGSGVAHSSHSVHAQRGLICGSSQA